MLLTEEDAKTKKCCGPGDCGHSMLPNEPGFPTGTRVCIGSACMAWRRVTQPFANGEPEPTPRGYCGLAGSVTR